MALLNCTLLIACSFVRPSPSWTGLTENAERRIRHYCTPPLTIHQKLNIEIEELNKLGRFSVICHVFLMSTYKNIQDVERTTLKYILQVLICTLL